MDVIVIGAGASGMMAAVTAAQHGAKVTLLEKMEKPGKKLLITGNGRCNLTNSSYEREDTYRSDDISAVNHALSRFCYRDTISWFQNLGLLLQEKNGYYYPVSNQAVSVLDILLQEMRRLSVKQKYQEKVLSISKEGNQWLVKTEGWQYQADKVIFAAGSKAAPVTGSDGNGYDILKKLGFQIQEPGEALVPLKVKEKWVKKLAGIRMPVKLTLSVEENSDTIKTYHDQGELQWTEYGISGIAVFQLSRYAVLGIREGKKVTMELDLLPSMKEKKLLHFMTIHLQQKKAEDVLSGVMPKKMIPVFMELAKSAKKNLLKEKPENIAECFTMLIKHLSVQIIGSKGFDMAQSCSGGISVKEINPDSMEAVRFPGLYL
ncbi:MAG: NAD(P)/FAD-dependent oxidoreductase, partial [Muricoprocola sp.]